MVNGHLALLDDDCLPSRASYQLRYILTHAGNEYAFRAEGERMICRVDHINGYGSSRQILQWTR